MRHPMKIRIERDKSDHHQGQWFDDEAYAHHSGDTLYIRADMMWEYLLEKGYDLTVSIKEVGNE